MGGVAAGGDGLGRGSRGDRGGLCGGHACAPSGSTRVLADLRRLEAVMIVVDADVSLQLPGMLEGLRFVVSGAASASSSSIWRASE